MSRKLTVLAIFILIASLTLLFASLFTYKWYVDDTQTIGVFGVCEFVNQTNRMITINNSSEFIEVYNNSSNSSSINKRDILGLKSFFGQTRFDLFSSSKLGQKCFQLLWPDTLEAFNYLSS